MFGSVIEPRDLLREMRSRHMRHLTEAEARLLSLLHLGYRNEEIAQLLEVTPATVRRHVADLCHRVLDLTDVPPERDKLRTWTTEHLSCCTLCVKEMIENDQELVWGDQHHLAGTE